MRFSINIDDDILKEIIDYYKANTNNEAVEMALKECCRNIRRRKLMDIRGKIDIEDNLNELKNYEIRKLNEIK